MVEDLERFVCITFDNFLCESILDSIVTDIGMVNVWTLKKFIGYLKTEFKASKVEEVTVITYKQNIYLYVKTWFTD